MCIRYNDTMPTKLYCMYTKLLDSLKIRRITIINQNEYFFIITNKNFKIILSYIIHF